MNCGECLLLSKLVLNGYINNSCMENVVATVLNNNNFFKKATEMENESRSKRSSLKNELPSSLPFCVKKHNI
ncbi:hypothetical protein T4C_6862 [Trichinella pseudospiralis]|uniref:Uncharacterized protein n=1 Tax=Trichinella pseudospiralis TaxID=6337 RepID=A0A0V1K4A2_TRIPS|nr:hypothetical protein T4C_6862 [Trichinella pseudospiralis]